MRRLGLALLLPLVLTTGGCGLPAGGDAHAVGSADLPLPPAPSPTTEPTASETRTGPAERHVSVPARVYFVRDRKVAPVTTIVRTKDADPILIGTDLLEQLVIGPTAEVGKGMTSKLVGQRRMDLVEVDEDVAVLELGPPPASGGETRDGLWTAQVVMTLCSIKGIAAVRFTGIEGEALKVVLPNGKLVSGDISPRLVADAVEPGGAEPPAAAGPTSTGRVAAAPVMPSTPAPAAARSPLATARPRSTR